MPFTGLTLVDEDTLRCAYEDGTEPYAVHHFMPAKPWLEPTIPGVYSRLLSRLLRGRDVAIQVPRSELPAHLRPGLVGAAKSWRHGGLSHTPPHGALAHRCPQRETRELTWYPRRSRSTASPTTATSSAPSRCSTRCACRPHRADLRPRLRADRSPARAARPARHAGPGPRRAPPWLMKTIAPLRHPAEVMVLIDTDMIVTRPFTELIEDAAAGKVAAFRAITTGTSPSGASSWASARSGGSPTSARRSCCAAARPGARCCGCWTRRRNAFPFPTTAGRPGAGSSSSQRRHPPSRRRPGCAERRVQLGASTPSGWWPSTTASRRSRHSRGFG